MSLSEDVHPSRRNTFNYFYRPSRIRQCAAIETRASQKLKMGSGVFVDFLHFPVAATRESQVLRMHVRRRLPEADCDAKVDFEPERR
jgi:hypothetical protein